MIKDTPRADEAEGEQPAEGDVLAIPSAVQEVQTKVRAASVMHL